MKYVLFLLFSYEILSDSGHNFMDFMVNSPYISGMDVGIKILFKSNYNRNAL